MDNDNIMPVFPDTFIFLCPPTDIDGKPSSLRIGMESPYDELLRCECGDFANVSANLAINWLHYVARKCISRPAVKASRCVRSQR